MGLFPHWAISPISWVTGVMLVKRRWSCIFFPSICPTIIILTEIDLGCRENLVSSGQLQYYSSSVNPTYLHILIVRLWILVKAFLFVCLFCINQLVFIGLFIFTPVTLRAFVCFLSGQWKSSLLLIHQGLLSFIVPTSWQGWMGTQIEQRFHLTAYLSSLQHKFWLTMGFILAQIENKWRLTINNKSFSSWNIFVVSRKTIYFKFL